MGKCWNFFCIITIFVAQPAQQAEIVWNNALYAFNQNNEQAVIELLKNNSLLKTYIHADGTSIAHYACALGFKTVLKWLIKHHGTLTAINRRKMTPLHYAVIAYEKKQSNNAIKIVDMLIKAYSPTDYCKGDEAGNTALHYAVKRGLLPLIYILTPYKELLSVKNNYQETPLHQAVELYKTSSNAEHEALFDELITHTPINHFTESSLWKLNPYEEAIKNPTALFLELKYRAESLLENLSS